MPSTGRTTMPITRTSLAGLAGLAFTSLALALICTTDAPAADWPSRPIHIIVPYAAGGPTDLTIRTLAPVVSTELGQTVVVENKLGGATMAFVVVPDGSM